jgi:hypothetical protein
MHSKFVPLLASAGLLAFPLQDSSAIPIIYTVDAGSSVSANRSEPSLGINTALISSLSGTTFPLDETGQSSIRPAGRFRADRQGSMAVSYGHSFSFSPSRISTNEPMLDAKNFVHKGIVATRDFSEPSTRAGLTGSASQSNGSFDRTFSLEQTNFAHDVVDWNSPASTSVPAAAHLRSNWTSTLRHAPKIRRRAVIRYWRSQRQRQGEVRRSSRFSARQRQHRAAFRDIPFGFRRRCSAFRKSQGYLEQNKARPGSPRRALIS